MLLGCVERVGVLLVWVERVCDHYLPSITEPLSFGRSLTFATKASFVFGDNACCANKLGEGEGEGEGVRPLAPPPAPPPVPVVVVAAEEGGTSGEYVCWREMMGEWGEYMVSHGHKRGYVIIIVIIITIIIIIIIILSQSQLQPQSSSPSSYLILYTQTFLHKLLSSELSLYL